MHLCKYICNISFNSFLIHFEWITLINKGRGPVFEVSSFKNINNKVIYFSNISDMLN